MNTRYTALAILPGSARARRRRGPLTIARRLIVLGVVLCVAALTTVAAHPMTHQGTVLAVEPARVHVKTVDDATKKEESIWFAVDKNTRVRRGEKTVAYSDANIAVGERIVVTVDMDARVKMLATDIRLAARK
jgi:hypothetical protein